MVSGTDAVLAGACIEKITTTFPMYPLQGQVRRDIEDAYRLKGGVVDELPGLPEAVGGDVDFLVGAKYLRYYPEPIFSLPSGLTIYKSPFLNVDGTRGVVGGPHSVFTEVSKMFNSQHKQLSHFSEQLQMFSQGYLINPDEYYLHSKFPKDLKQNITCLHCVNEEVDQWKSKGNIVKRQSLMTSWNEKLFNEVENAGSEILYRCVNCRSCKVCPKGEKVELMSIQEEVEQDIINKSVVVDIAKGVVMASLPVMCDAETKLAPNKNKALAVFRSQAKKLSKEDKQDIIQSEKKLQDLGYVDYVKNLTLEQKQKLKSSNIQNFIPWRAVWNENSCSTPCRMVFDASQPTSSSYSLNDIIAKGRNSMNKLIEIVIRWSIYPVGLHTDIQKMYNSVRLIEDDWCFQRYVWQDELDENKIPEEKVIKTLIYGVKSSGNQAERGLRETAQKSKGDYPVANKIIQDDIYVDDCITGAFSTEMAYKNADELTLVLKKGGFNLKGVTFSGRKPMMELTSDGSSINVAGCKWFPENDSIRLDISELNFSKRVRGKKNPNADNKIPEVITRRHCVGKVSEIFDLTGRITPLTASMKLDLHDMIERGLNRDDALPDDLRRVWKSHFDMIQDLKVVTFQRAIIPEDAVNTEIETVDMGDASQKIAATGIYGRFKRKDGSYSCQLLFARSKILPKGLSQPRAELAAALLNTHTGEVVRRSLGQYFKKGVKLTDSQIVLHWLNNKDLPLKQWVRNRVVEILRFSHKDSWWYIDSTNMLVDLATRKGATIADIGPESKWTMGLSG